jgi:hypothetical protein
MARKARRRFGPAARRQHNSAIVNPSFAAKYYLTHIDAVVGGKRAKKVAKLAKPNRRIHAP